jgi:hypothetical protein
VDLGELSHGLAVRPERPRLDRSDRCKPLVGFVSGELPDSCVFGMRCC